MSTINNISALFQNLMLLLTFVGCMGIVGLFNSCQQEKLPVLGKMEADFGFTNQDGQRVDKNTFADKIYVTDFFFTSCPTICPTMKAQLLRVYEVFEGDKEFRILSHSIDPKHDSVAVLKDYAERLGVKSHTWHMVTGEKDDIMDMAEQYMVSVVEDERAPGGIVHSGAFMLIDKQKQLRGVYNGTDEAEVTNLIKDIRRLKAEQ